MKPVFVVIFFVFGIGALANAQDMAKASYQEVTQPHLQVDKQAMYPGGKKGIDLYIMQNIRYPQQAREQRIEGKVYAKFTVGKKGKITKIEFLQSDHPLFEKEAERLLKGMGKWIPAYVDEQPVEVSYMYPFTFKLG
ncbi:energy transducer TonB [Rhodocytophaga aerolata]|uniref:Energy transducer TonB n=1 Tax=Rhodocytophaga aerolata TaxID=455078 RepID=A0ABT8RDS2_9BACT|nr:energy transducer TonB [Rhodocytophaga aerolata]MDO1449846.1 energy transducer TonB [Rhodocytophaga aerolata]